MTEQTNPPAPVSVSSIKWTHVGQVAYCYGDGRITSATWWRCDYITADGHIGIGVCREDGTIPEAIPEGSRVIYQPKGATFWMLGKVTDITRPSHWTGLWGNGLGVRSSLPSYSYGVKLDNGATVRAWHDGDIVPTTQEPDESEPPALYYADGFHLAESFLNSYNLALRNARLCRESADRRRIESKAIADRRQAAGHEQDARDMLAIMREWVDTYGLDAILRQAEPKTRDEWARILNPPAPRPVVVVQALDPRTVTGEAVTTPTGITITATKHTQTGADIWVAKLAEKLPDDQYQKVAARVRANGGYWSKFVRGFVFKSLNSAQRFANADSAEPMAVDPGELAADRWNESQGGNLYNELTR